VIWCSRPNQRARDSLKCRETFFVQDRALSMTAEMRCDVQSLRSPAAIEIMSSMRKVLVTTSSIRMS
jgi:hypothetical protein